MGKATAAEATSKSREKKKKDNKQRQSSHICSFSLGKYPTSPDPCKFCPPPHHKITDPAHYGYP